MQISCKAGQRFNVHHSHVGKRKLISSRTCRLKTSAIYWGFVPFVLSLCLLDSHLLSLLFGFVENHKFPSNAWQQFREWRFSSNLAMAPYSRLVLGVPRERLAIGVIELWSNSTSSFLHRRLCFVAFPPFFLSYWDNFSSSFLCLVSPLVSKVDFSIDGKHNVRLYLWRPQDVFFSIVMWHWRSLSYEIFKHCEVGWRKRCAPSLLSNRLKIGYKTPIRWIGVQS